MRPDRRAISEDDITAMTTFPFPGGGMRVLSSVLVGPPCFPLCISLFLVSSSEFSSYTVGPYCTGTGSPV